MSNPKLEGGQYGELLAALKKVSIKGGLLCVVPSFKNNASIFQEIFFIQYFNTFSCKSYDVITYLICIIQNVNISGTKKDISKRKTPFFCISKGLSNKQKIFFMSYTLLINILTII